MCRFRVDNRGSRSDHPAIRRRDLAALAFRGPDVRERPLDILILNAEPELLDALRTALDDEPARLQSLADVESVRAACRVGTPALIVVDLAHGPDDSAYAACRQLHTDGASTHVPMLLLGRSTEPADIARGLATGAADLITPPFDPALLRARLRPHLAATQARAELALAQRARQDAEQASRAAHRAKSDLLASMGHEIRTPMTAILGMSHLALQSGLNPKQRNYIEKVERSAELLLGTLNDILDSSRIEAGTLELQRTPFELADLLDSVGRLVALRAEDKGLELLFDLPPDLPTTCIGDLSRLGQVLVNLGLDAVRAGQQGEIVIAIQALERSATQVVLRFSVLDTGGTPATRSAPGIELGAMLSRQLLHLMGSELHADTPSEGGAHEVHFTLALGLPTAPPAAPPQRLPAGARTLVVDDNASARRILLAMCAELGLAAEAARDGWDALRMASHAQRAGSRYELVLLDWKMAGMDGIECARHLLAAHTRPPAILMLTACGQHDASQRLAAQRVAVRGVLAKPVTPANLASAIGRALQPPPLVDSAADRSAAMRDHAARLRGARILLVEDNVIIQELALELLSSAGMLVSLAENGREALDRLAKQSFDGVLMDCQMPVLDGYEATQALRAMPHLKDLPVIALTANAFEGDRERVLAAGMNDHIAKPLDVDLMFATLARWVRPARPIEAVEIAPAPAEVEDPLARLPGIDVKVGRSSTMNNDKLYRRLLGMFRDGQRDVVAQFRAARSAGDDATAMRLAHNLRAVSASLGALAVQRSAGALERACADKSPDTTVEPLLAQVALDLEPVIDGLVRLLPAP